MPYPTVPSPAPMETWSPKLGVPTPKICIVHYEETVSAEWLLLTGYRHLPMPNLMPPCPSPSPQTGTDPSPNTWYLGFKWNQTAAGSNMVFIDSLWELANCTIASPLWTPVLQRERGPSCTMKAWYCVYSVKHIQLYVEVHREGLWPKHGWTGRRRLRGRICCKHRLSHHLCTALE